MAETTSRKTGSERRRYSRRRLKIFVHYVFFEKGKVFRALESQTLDIGAGGAAILGDRPLKRGQKLMITLFLPAPAKGRRGESTLVSLGDPCLQVAILSQVAWCGRRDGREFVVGIEFMEPAHTHRKRLLAFCADFGLDQPPPGKT